MAVTYRRPVKTGTTSDFGDETRVTRRCRGCGSEHEIEVEAPDLLTIRIGSRMCDTCNPFADDNTGSDRAIMIKSWFTTPSDGPPQWKTMLTRPGGKIEYRSIEVSTDPVAMNVDGNHGVAWRHAISESGTANWNFLHEIWQPEHCSAIDALATALDDMWRAVAAAAHIVIRLTDVAPVVAAVLVNVVRRTLAVDERLPIALLSRLFREVAMTACAGTARIDTCHAVRHALGAVPPLTGDAIETLGVPRAIAALAGISPPGSPDEFDEAAHLPTVVPAVPRSAGSLGAILGKLPQHDVPSVQATFGIR